MTAGHGEVHGPDDGGGAVDGLGDGDLVDGDVGVEAVHVLDGVDGDAAAADLAEREGVVGVTAHEGGEVKGGGEAGVGFGLGGLAGVEDVLEAFVGVVGGAEAGELAHGPEAGAVALGEEAAGVGELARGGDVAGDVFEGFGGLVGGVGGVEDDAGNGDGVGVDGAALDGGKSGVVGGGHGLVLPSRACACVE